MYHPRLGKTTFDVVPSTPKAWFVPLKLMTMFESADKELRFISL
jgi:hypothetical protein